MSCDLEEALRRTAEQVTPIGFDLRKAQATARRRRQRRAARLSASSIAVVVLLSLAVDRPWTAGEQGSASVVGTTGISGVEQFTHLGRRHVEGPVNYGQDPPVGGDHDPQPQTCAVYTRPIPNGSAVHSLEHGAVWITYGPDVPARQVRLLEKVARSADKVIVSPYPALSRRISLQAWGLQLVVADANDPRIAEFVRAYVNGPQTPERGASCQGSTRTVGDPHDPTPSG